MPFRDMIPINRPILDDLEIRAVARVIRTGLLTSKSGSGANVMQFEDTFAKFVGTRYAVAVNSGTAALHAALLAAGINRDDEVILPSFTFVATAEAIAMAGAVPVFVDIDPDTYCIKPDDVEIAITDRTKAVIPVHLYGLAANMDPIVKIADDHNLVVVEDACQAHGAEYQGKRAGNLGHMACFSFYGSKSMVTGEGGMVTTNDRELSDLLRTIRNHGESRVYQSDMLGHNYRMPEMEAALGCVQLGKLPSFLEARSKNAVYLSEALNATGGLQLPKVPEGCRHGWYVYTLRLKGANAAKRNKVVRRIREKRVDCQVYYPRPIHLQSYYKAFNLGNLTDTETAARQVFSIPVHPGLHEIDLKRIVSAVTTAMD